MSIVSVILQSVNIFLILAWIVLTLVTLSN